jgi:hypothetical protein
MSVHQGSVTIPNPAAAIALVKGLTPTATRVPCYEIVIQKNSANAIRVGDSTVTATTGAAVAASNAAPGPLYLGPYSTLALDLATTFVFGTAGDTVDFVYVK